MELLNADLRRMQGRFDSLFLTIVITVTVWDRLLAVSIRGMHWWIARLLTYGSPNLLLTG